MIPGGWIYEGGGHILVPCLSNQLGQLVVRYDDSGLVVDVKGEIHVGKKFDKLLHHADGGLLLPFLASSDVQGLTIPDQECNEIIAVEPYCFSNPSSYGFRF